MRTSTKIIIFLPISVAFLAIGVAWSFRFGGINFDDLLPWLGFRTVSTFTQGMLDTSNDEAANLNTHQLLERAGFRYENYYAMSDDGYITQLVRVVNPLAKRGHLKKPPIMIQHGQTSNSRNFIMQSNKQHHPMPCGTDESGISLLGQNNDNLAEDDNELESDGSNKVINKWIGKPPSSERSLALMLANNCFDVWLSSNRGVDENNRAHVYDEATNSIYQGKNRKKNMTEGEDDLMRERLERGYWGYTLDDQISHETPSQIAVVLNVTNSDKISLVGYSNTALTTLSMLSIRPDIAPLVDTYIGIAPVVYYSKLQGYMKWWLGEFMQLAPRDIDSSLFISEKVANFTQRTLIKLCTDLSVRYTLCKLILDIGFGKSSQTRTNLELPFFGHIMHPTSWKCLVQHVQIVKRAEPAKFDYGRKLNKRYYGTPQSPTYDLSLIDPRVNIALISGDADSWATPATIDRIRDTLARPPILDLRLVDYNHLDLAGAFNVDRKVNRPILDLLDRRHRHLTGMKTRSDVAIDTKNRIRKQSDGFDLFKVFTGRRSMNPPIDTEIE